MLTAAFVPLKFALGDAFQFDWSEQTGIRFIGMVDFGNMAAPASRSAGSGTELPEVRGESGDGAGGTRAFKQDKRHPEYEVPWRL